MNEELEPKIKCRYCSEVFVLFEELERHAGKHIRRTEFNKWLAESDKKVESFEATLEESLDT